MELSDGFEGEADFDRLAVFDRAHLQQYTMDSPQLEREVVGLFLQQLPDIMRQLGEAQNAKDWRLWAHTLKGSAVSVGAKQIWALAQLLERPEFHEPSVERGSQLLLLAEMVDSFERVARQIYPPNA